MVGPVSVNSRVENGKRLLRLFCRPPAFYDFDPPFEELIAMEYREPQIAGSRINGQNRRGIWDYAFGLNSYIARHDF